MSIVMTDEASCSVLLFPSRARLPGQDVPVQLSIICTPRQKTWSGVCRGRTLHRKVVAYADGLENVSNGDPEHLR